VSIGFESTDHLSEQGGPVGYGVRPRFRRRGYAGENLRQALVVARAEGVDRALVTCDVGEGSAAVILGNGGVEVGPRVGEGGLGQRRFWIG